MTKRSAKNASGGRSSRSKSASLKSKSSAKPSSPSKASPFPSEWSEFIGLLCAHRVRFLIVGAHALGVIGRIRATKDLDLLVDPTPTNARRVGAAPAEFGFAALADRVMEFAKPERMATLGREPLRIDIMTSITGVTFAEAWRSRVKARLGGFEIAVLGRDAFLKNERATGRAHDLADVALVEEIERTTRG